MQQCEVHLVDAFADEPTGGRPVAVVPGEVPTPRQRAAIASEFGTSGVITVDESLTYTDCDGSQAVVSAAVAGFVGLQATGELQAGSHELTVDGPVSPADPFLVDLESDGRARVEVGNQSPERAAVEPERIARTLGIDPAALRDVGADLPVSHVEAFGGTLLAPVNFLQHLTGGEPDQAGLADLLADVGAKRLCAFTFDTLGAETDVHARVYDPLARGNERPASGVAAAACAATLADHQAFDGDREQIRVESGHRQNRPATVTTTLEAAPSVGGAALGVLQGTLTLPPEEDEEIIEL